MNLTATLLVQSFTFLVFVFLTWRFAWPPILNAMKARQAKIADGLAAADKGAKSLQDASLKSDEALKAARSQAQEILGAANKQAGQIVEKAKADAETEKARIIAAGHAEVEREVAHARETLRRQVGDLAVTGASRILQREIDPRAHAEVLEQLAAQV